MAAGKKNIIYISFIYIYIYILQFCIYMNYNVYAYFTDGMVISVKLNQAMIMYGVKSEVNSPNCHLRRENLKQMKFHHTSVV